MIKLGSAFTGVLISASLVASVSVGRADVWGDYTTSYQNYMDAQMAQAAQNKSDADQQLQDLQKKAAKLKNKQAKDSQNLQDDQATVDSLKRTEAALEAELNQLQEETPPPPKKFLFIPIKSAQQKKIESAQGQLADIRQQLVMEQQKQSQAQMKTNMVAGSIQQEQVSATTAQSMVDQRDGEMQKLSTPSYQMMIAQEQARAVLDKQMQNHYDANFLLSDMQTLQQKNKLTQLQAQAMQQVWDAQLNGTLMGEYVNNQIKKAMASTCDPSFQNACAAGKMDVLNGLINTKLNAALNSADAHSTSGDPQSMKDAAPAGGSAAPASVAPASVRSGKTN